MQLEVGQIVEGKITGITNFGVFADLGEGKTGMVHISEVAHSFVTDIRQFVKEGETVKVKILAIGDDGKISLSIKRAQEQPKSERPQRNYESRRPAAPAKPDPTAVWTPKKQESSSFEEMMSRFKQTSDEKFSDLKRKNPETRRPKRSAGMK